MLQKSTVAALTLIMTACAHQVPKTDAPTTPSTVTTEVQTPENQELAAALESKVVKAYVCYLCTLPQPDRWGKAKTLLTTNHLIASCAFDKDHPIPANTGPGAVATTRPVCPVEQGQSVPPVGQGESGR